MSRRLWWRTLLVLAVLGGATALVVTRDPRLGLDLRGGTQIVLEAQDTPEVTVDRDTVARTVEVMRRRVDQLGVAEPTLQAAGDRRIIVELPGVTDPDEALEVIGQTAQLTFHRVRAEVPPGDEQPEQEGDELILPDEDGALIRLGPRQLTGDAVTDARATIESQGFSGWQVSIDFRGDGRRAWEEMTADAACEPLGDPQRRIAIVLDDEVISSPQVGADVQCGTGIVGGTTVITGNFTQEEARNLGLLIRAGALPVPVEVIEQRTIGPTLGEAAIDASVRAAIIGAILTALYILAYYRILGVLAAIALGVYGLLSFAVLLGIGATLTLPGVAGFVLAIGMAVDANVLVFERIKEEHATGMRVAPAATTGFQRAWSAIADSNATTLIAAFLLFYFASGAVRGFGVTLSIGVAVSMFTALVVTRVMVELLVRTGLASRPTALGLNVGTRLRDRLAQRGPDLMRHGRRWIGLSTVVVLVAVAGMVIRGMTFGLDFTGGRLVEYSTTRPVDVDRARADLAERGFPGAIVQRAGEGNVSIRTRQLTDDEEDEIRSAIAELGGTPELVREEFVGPTIGDELRRRALIALAIALAAQLAYMAIRFRWTYGAAAVAAMFHDVAVLIGLFAWLGKTYDGVFLAALLTVIGYSVNDSVVVFDRVREQRRARRREPFAKVANDAALQTLPRTINTGLGAMFILVALWLLGGETLADFALALLIGFVVGSYSSILTAAPIAVALEGRWPAPQVSEQPSARRTAERQRRRRPGGYDDRAQI